MSSFFTMLEETVAQTGSLLCVGLDPHLEDLDQVSGRGAVDFCRHIIEATHDLASAYKPNAAFFEALGAEGFRALREVIEIIPEGIPVILDVKRGDISSTARAYARAAFGQLGAQAVTLNPYLGRDAVEPFLENPARGVFMLCKTSNPGGADLQDLKLAARPGEPPFRERDCLYLHVARLAQSWNQRGNLGLVVGATQPESLARIRQQAPELWFLSPGVGAQGGDLQAALRAGLREDGLGMLIPVSRGISRAASPREAAETLRNAIDQEREKLLKEDILRRAQAPSEQVRGLAPSLAALAEELMASGCIKFGDFTLKSGAHSPVYIDLRRLIANPLLLHRVAKAYLPLLGELDFDHLTALPYAALPITTAISLHSGWPLIYPRKEAKDYGTKAVIEGVFKDGETTVVVDDLITTGGSKYEGIRKLEGRGLRVQDVVVLIDRSRNAGEEMAEKGYRLHAVLDLPAMIEHYQQKGMISSEKAAAVRKFLSGGKG